MFRTLLITALLLGLLGTGFFLFQETGKSMSFYYEVDEVPPQTTAEIKMSGIVEPGSLEKDPHTRTLLFTVAGKTRKYPVRYQGTVPDIFREGIQVVVTGRFQGGVFEARELLAKCPSKYLPQGSPQDFSPTSLPPPLQ